MAFEGVAALPLPLAPTPPEEVEAPFSGFEIFGLVEAADCDEFKAEGGGLGCSESGILRFIF